MKTILVSFLMIAVSSSALAETMSVRAEGQSCDHLQQLLEEQQTLHIITGPFDWGNDYVSEDGLCPNNKDPRAAYVSTADNSLCRVGWACVRRP